MKISKMRSETNILPNRKRVAAYARASAATKDELRSLAAQISFYNELISSNSEWVCAGVYADRGVSGTRVESRREFRRMLSDCERGKIDVILTKSVSRFARNTVSLLETVRRLRELGVEVRFERERINSLDINGELMLTIMASFAQEESRSISENVRWGIRRGFERGRMNTPRLYGYRSVNGTLEIEPREAEVVRLIYSSFLSGKTARQTETQLAEMGVVSRRGERFSRSAIYDILRQEKYTGNATLQRWYIEDHITHKKRRNNGELPMYRVENSHAAIIDMETFERVQGIIAARRELGIFASGAVETSCFTSRIRCGLCGRSYRRYGRYNRRGERVYSYWGCCSRKKSTALCGNANIREEQLKAACASALGTERFDEERFMEEITEIKVTENGHLEFVFRDIEADAETDGGKI